MEYDRKDLTGGKEDPVEKDRSPDEERKRQAQAPPAQKAASGGKEPNPSGENLLAEEIPLSIRQKSDKPLPADQVSCLRAQVQMQQFLLKQQQERQRQLERERGNIQSEKEQIDAVLSQIRKRYAALEAEYENYRRRTEEEKKRLGAEAVVKAVAALLPAMDSLEKATEYGKTDTASYRKGVELTLQQIHKGFQALGVEEIPAQGKTFDPSRHNAVMHIKDPSLGESEIADVFQKGYAIGDRVIRHAVVKVAN